MSIVPNLAMPIVAGTVGVPQLALGLKSCESNPMGWRRMFVRRLAILAAIVTAFAFLRVTQQTAPAAEPVGRETIVYVTKTGSKYHRGGCQYLRHSKIAMTLSQAARVYEPCLRCRPPTVE